MPAHLSCTLLQGQSKPEERAVCRICLEEDVPSNLEQPCACTGTMAGAAPCCPNSGPTLLCGLPPCRQPQLAAAWTQPTCQRPDTDGPAVLCALAAIHHSCLQRWIDEKGDRSCEICKQEFQGDYTDPPAPPPRPQHVNLWGQEFLVLADPETGALRAHRLQVA